MRAKPPPNLEKWRIPDGPYGSDASYGMTGAFHIRLQTGLWISVISSDGKPDGWEHVSVSMKQRTPRWAEMVYVKKLFWEPHECVVQYHPAESDYVNDHPNCLHLWRSLQEAFPMPPLILV
jgi:hypothetical protein